MKLQGLNGGCENHQVECALTCTGCTPQYSGAHFGWRAGEAQYNVKDQLFCKGNERQVLLADVTGDGKADLVCFHWTSGSVSYVPAKGDGEFDISADGSTTLTLLDDFCTSQYIRYPVEVVDFADQASGKLLIYEPGRKFKNCYPRR